MDLSIKIENGDKANDKPTIIEMKPIQTETNKDSLQEKPQEEEIDDGDDSGWENSDNDDDGVDDIDDERSRQICGRCGNPLTMIVEKVQFVCKTAVNFVQKYTKGYFVRALFLILYIAYFITALCYRSSDEGAHRLIGCTVLMTVILFRHRIRQGFRWLCQKITGSTTSSLMKHSMVLRIRLFIRWILYVVLAFVAIWALVDEGIRKPSNLRSIPGLIIFILICLMVSTKPSKINWHTVYWSLGLQFLMALFALRWQFGRDAILWVQRRLDEFFANTQAGSTLLFGPGYREHELAFGALPVFIFTNATIAILYYLGAMQFVVLTIGSFMQFALDTTPVEAMNVAAGIFLEGVSSIAAFIPYVKTATRSQLFLIMTSGFASVGGGFLAILASVKVPTENLIAAMIISAPATFAVCKLMMPETQKPIIHDAVDVGEREKKKYANILDAAQSGAIVMLGHVGGLAVNALTLWSFIAWINSTLTWFGERVGIENLTIDEISSYILYPVALGMGVEPDDCRNVGMLLGYRLSSTNLLAFIKMIDLKVNRIKYQQYMLATNFTGPVLHDKDDIILPAWNMTLTRGYITERSEAIATYALTGFSSFVSAAILLTLLCVMLPKRKAWVAKNTLLALIAGNIANCMTGCFASLFY